MTAAWCRVAVGIQTTSRSNHAVTMSQAAAPESGDCEARGCVAIRMNANKEGRASPLGCDRQLPCQPSPRHVMLRQGPVNGIQQYVRDDDHHHSASASKASATLVTSSRKPSP